ERVVVVREVVLGARVRGAVALHAETGRGAGDVAAVAIAVERIRIRYRHGGRNVGVVVVADEIGTAFNLGGTRSEQRGIRWGRAGRCRRVERGHGSRTTEVGMRVVDACVDDADLDVLTVDTVHAGPGSRRADAWHADRVVDVMGSEAQ